MEMLNFGGQYYLDDRMFVVDVESVPLPDGSGEWAAACWAVTTRRNVPGYALFRQRLFASREQALALLHRQAPQTPRLSLQGLSPIPPPSYEQHNDWLRERGL